MKRLIILISIVASTFSGLCQDCKINIPGAFFYRFVDNPIEVFFKNDSCKNIIVTTDNGTISSYGTTDSSCNYIVRPEQTIYTTISVYKITPTDSILLLSEKIRTRPLPSPWAMLGTVVGQEQFTLQQLKSCSGLNSELVNVGHDISFPILSYTVIGIHDSTMVFLMDIIGSKFTMDLQDKFDLLQKNDRVIFTNIVAQLLNDQKATLNSIEIKIK